MSERSLIILWKKLWRRPSGSKHESSLSQIIKPTSAFDLALLVYKAVDFEDSCTRTFDDAGFFDVQPRKRPRSPSPAHCEQSHRNQKRAAKRRMKVEVDGHSATERTLFEHVQLAEQIETAIDTSALPADSSGFGGLRLTEDKELSERVYTLEELIADGFEVIEWDGKEARPLVDADGRIFAVLAGMPGHPEYLRAAERVYEMLMQAREQEAFLPEELEHRRGNFPAIFFGMSYGNGQEYVKPCNVGQHGDLIDTLLRNKDLDRLAQYADSAFQLWAPKLYKYYKEHMDQVEQHTGAKRNFERSVFACASMNFGPHVRCFKHRDHLNLPFGWCAIQALGQFNPKLGGHLVIWDLKYIIEFPAGATILIPSATLTHSNIPIREGETRLSFTQYSAGGIFRWVQNGFMTENRLKKTNKAKYIEMCRLKKTRWEMGLSLYSTLSELLDDI